MDKEKEIGEIFRESLEGYQAEPPAGLWEAIYQDKTLVRFNRRKRWLWAAKISAFPLAGLISVVVISVLFAPKPPKDETLVVTPETAVVAPAAPTVTPTVNIPSVPVVTSEKVISSAPVPSQNTEAVAFQDTENEKVEKNTELSAITETPVVAETPTVAVPSVAVKEVPATKVSQPAESVIVPEPRSGRSGQLTHSKDTSVCRNSKLTLFVHNALDVHWNIGMQGEAVTLYPEEPMLIAATVTTYDKTDTTIYIQVGVFDCGLWIPTAFTPNGDGLNDEFLVHAPATITHYECAIYDRSRGLLFRTNNILQGWDGTFNGKQLPLGSYFYIITYRDEAGMKHVEKGQITLIR